MKVMLFVVWLVLFMYVSTILFEMVSCKDTLINIAGILLFAISIWVSIRTKCLTNISLKKKK